VEPNFLSGLRLARQVVAWPGRPEDLFKPWPDARVMGKGSEMTRGGLEDWAGLAVNEAARQLG